MGAARSLTSTELTLRAQAAAHTSWANTPDRTARTKHGRDRFLARFEETVDPERKLSPQARAQAAESARRAYFSRLAYLSARARRKPS
jgi:hypothetical protein